MAKTRKRAGSGELQPDGQTSQSQPESQPEFGAPQSAGDTMGAMPERDRIAMRAYELYLERGGADGAALDDWLNAERELGPSERRDE